MSTLLCEVGLNDFDCEAPGGMNETDEPIRTHCWQCGQRACKACTRMVLRGGGLVRRRRRRVCADCNGDYWPVDSA